MAKFAKNINKKPTTPKRILHCPYCDTDKVEDEFYVSSDPLRKTGRSEMCVECATKIAKRYNPDTGQFDGPTRESVMDAIERLDKPFFGYLWEASIQEVMTSNKKHDPWATYIKNVSMKNYRTMRWRDSDIFGAEYRANVQQPANERNDVALAAQRQAELREEYEANKLDVIRLIGYDPFAKEQEADKPLLYAQLIQYLDGEGNNDDMMRVSSAVSIVRSFSELSKIDDTITEAIQKKSSAPNLSGTVKALTDVKKQLSATITQLAEQSCISLKHSRNATKGENTWTGKIKKIKDINLRQGEVNGFDIATCRGMQQVMDMSNQSIMRTLALDESEYADMLAEQRQLVVDLRKQADARGELVRILLRENLDLRDLIEDKGIDIRANLVNLENLLSQYGEISQANQDGDDNGD